jgi:cytoskeletal protein CcmA (bactofilin family)
VSRPSRWALALVSLLGCSDELSFGRLRTVDAATPFACDLRGPLFEVGDGDPRCPGFHHALCSCGDYVSAGPSEVTGALAIGGLLSAGDLRVDGPLTLAGAQGAALTGDLRSESLASRGPVQGNHAVTIAGDARIAGDVRLRSLSVGRTLTLANAAALEIAEGNAPSPVREPVEVTSPCSCAPTLDVGAQIDRARSENDNAMIELAPERGLRTFESARELELPCGRYYVAEIYAASPLTLRVRGRVALYVDQRVVTEASGSLTITLDDSAQLDLFIRRGVTGGGPITLGGGSTRIYVGGDDSFFFAAPTSLEATLYAPNSELVTQQAFTLTGAGLVKRSVAEQRLTLRQTTPRCE